MGEKLPSSYGKLSLDEPGYDRAGDRMTLPRPPFGARFGRLD
jgi:hypothetical protein